MFGPILASRLGCAFVPVRKQGKLPGKCISVTYQLEYGSDTFECQEGSIPQGATVVIIDDLIVSISGSLPRIRCIADVTVDLCCCRLPVS